MTTQTDQTSTSAAATSPEGRVFAISKSVNFEAAHYMGGKPEGHPYRNVHGHSFVLEATVAGTVKPGEQWVEDFSHPERRPAGPDESRHFPAKPE